MPRPIFLSMWTVLIRCLHQAPEHRRLGGLTTLEALRLLRGLRGLDLIDGDVDEAAPPFDQTGNTALVGASMMFEILCLLAESFCQRKEPTLANSV